MSTIKVQSLRSLEGEIKIQGSKNAVLPIMAATVLHKGVTVLKNVPKIQDVYCMMGILEFLGCNVTWVDNGLVIDASILTSCQIPQQYVKSMRSSIMLLGALLGRMKEAKTSFPGGCSIGARPVELHLKGLSAMGASIKTEGDVIEASVASRLNAGDIYFSYPSVGATENLIMAAVLAKGSTRIFGVAKEPEIEQLCLFLNRMGAKISGIGTSNLIIEGVERLVDCEYQIPGDRIVAGTYLACVMASGGEALLRGVLPCHLKDVIRQCMVCGASVKTQADMIFISSDTRPKPSHIMTRPYPGFPTDLQSPFLALLSIGQGVSTVEESVFEARFETVKELHKLGAEIIIEGNKAIVYGRYPLVGADVMARDLRGGAALVVAALAAQGTTNISHCIHIQRGYEDICRDLQGLGVDISYQIPSEC